MQKRSGSAGQPTRPGYELSRQLAPPCTVAAHLAGDLQLRCDTYDGLWTSFLAEALLVCPRTVATTIASQHQDNGEGYKNPRGELEITDTCQTIQGKCRHSDGAATAAPTSDVRLKRDIAQVEEVENGIALYRYRYLWSDTTYVGTMAQEVAAARRSCPETVLRGSDGYLRVDYTRLGPRLQTWDEWSAAH